MKKPSETRGPLILHLEDAPPPTPAEAPPVDGEAPHPPAMARALRRADSRQGGLAGAFWSLLAGFLLLALSLAAWDWAAGLVARHPLLGSAATVLLVALGVVALAIAGREVWALRRLARIDALQRRAAAALVGGAVAEARGVAADLAALYGRRPALAAAADRVRARLAEVLDADGLLRMAEAELLPGPDAEALAEIRVAARRVAALTALVPLPFADMAAALALNLRMIRRVAEAYGGRSGVVGSWRLVRAVAGHLIATGAVAVGDDMIGGLAGGTALARLSRRFGEGVLNGALTARVGLAAVEVCRPLPFLSRPVPTVTGTLGGALAGLFARGNRRPDPPG